MFRAARFLGALVALGFVVPACSSEADSLGAGYGYAQRTAPPSSDAGASCQVGTRLDCTCSDGKAATRACNAGKWAECGPCQLLGQAARCGDNVCSAPSETCDNCPGDCGACKLCKEAPACGKAMIPPGTIAANPALDVRLEAVPREQVIERMRQTIAQAGPAMRVIAAALDTTPHASETEEVRELRAIFQSSPETTASLTQHLAAVGLSSPPIYRAQFPEATGARVSYSRTGEFNEDPIACGAPQLRVRIASIEVANEASVFGRDSIYCAISSDAQSGGELKVTPKTTPMKGGMSYPVPLSQGLIWGQGGPRTPGSDLMIQYDCFESNGDAGYASLVKQVSDASTRAGGQIGGDYSWTFGVAGVLGNLAAGILAMNGDNHLLVATQTISEKDHLKMTNGAKWTVRKGGRVNFLSKWEWVLHMEAWGCAKYGGGQ